MQTWCSKSMSFPLRFFGGFWIGLVWLAAEVSPADCVCGVIVPVSWVSTWIGVGGICPGATTPTGGRDLVVMAADEEPFLPLDTEERGKRWAGRDPPLPALLPSMLTYPVTHSSMGKKNKNHPSLFILFKRTSLDGFIYEINKDY